MKRKEAKLNEDSVEGQNLLKLDEGVDDQVSWKRLANDVGRTPSYPLVLAFLMGTGAQVFVIVYTFLISMMFGLVNPLYKYIKLINLVVTIFVSGFVNGYVNARCIKATGTTDWAAGSTMAAFIFPTIVWLSLILIDVVEAIEHSSDYIPITSMTFYFCIWFAINLPSSYYGSVVGYK